jgi:hypothetical protein
MEETGFKSRLELSLRVEKGTALFSVSGLEITVYGFACAFRV